LRPLAEPAAKGSSGELAQARAKIAELERKIGQQVLDIDFFHKALRALKAVDRQGSITAASRKSSKP
jgi:transposase